MILKYNKIRFILQDERTIKINMQTKIREKKTKINYVEGGDLGPTSASPA